MARLAVLRQAGASSVFGDYLNTVAKKGEGNSRIVR